MMAQVDVTSQCLISSPRLRFENSTRESNQFAMLGEPVTLGELILTHFTLESQREGLC